MFNVLHSSLTCTEMYATEDVIEKIEQKKNMERIHKTEKKKNKKKKQLQELSNAYTTEG